MKTALVVLALLLTLTVIITKASTSAGAKCAAYTGSNAGLELTPELFMTDNDKPSTGIAGLQNMVVMNLQKYYPQVPPELLSMSYTKLALLSAGTGATLLAVDELKRAVSKSIGWAARKVVMPTTLVAALGLMGLRIVNRKKFDEYWNSAKDNVSNLKDAGLAYIGFDQFKLNVATFREVVTAMHDAQSPAKE
ncbi:Uncharacterized protein PBTT_10124 [Plasmodiophora brassicae]|uniref:Uncharacterized protein n=1 Tax=Plasmodiophora brassicae TaxID=37360 RepID=A0A0G4INT9_PLABS|nr:hypothetical protein PBRA_005511 [Plasmodiophora brassicae]